jgi:hypothetical protein
MNQPDSHNVPNLQSDNSMALDALFRRVAERERKVRMQNATAKSDNLGQESLSERLGSTQVEQNLTIHDSENGHAC